MKIQPLMISLLAATLAVTVLPTPALHADPAIELRIGRPGPPDRPEPSFADPRELSKALDNLERAKAHVLQSCPPNGRRDAALRSIEDAMAQIRGMLRHP